MMFMATSQWEKYVTSRITQVPLLCKRKPQSQYQSGVLVLCLYVLNRSDQTYMHQLHTHRYLYTNRYLYKVGYFASLWYRGLIYDEAWSNRALGLQKFHSWAIYAEPRVPSGVDLESLHHKSPLLKIQSAEEKERSATTIDPHHLY